MRLFILPWVVLVLQGCVHYDPAPQKLTPVPRDAENWSKVPVKQWEEVDWDRREHALKLLGANDFITVSKERAVWLVTPPESRKVHPSNLPTLEGLPGERLYLIRAKGHGFVGARIRVEKPSRQLYIHTVAWNMEFYLPGMRYDTRDIPIIVSLPFKPAKVHCAATISGDGAFNMIDQ
jgi:hypothetical protein